MVKTLQFLSFLLAATLCCSCSSMRPGKMAVVTPTSTSPRAGNVYLLRGWIGIFSTGIDELTVQINDQGVRANVFQDDQWRTLANTIKEKYKGKPAEPIILVGHSYGADDVVRIARELKADNIPVDMVITLDPVTPPNVTGNVKQCINLYQSNGVADALPFLRGVPLEKEKDTQTRLSNVNIRKDRTDLLEPGTDHFNIEKKQTIHKEVIAQILAICPPRATWLASRGGSVPAQPAPVVRASSTENPKPAESHSRFTATGGD